MITVRNIRKTYRVPGPGKYWPLRHFRTVEAIKDVSFDVAEGEIVALLGLNGSGKSTLIKILTGILAPTDGEVSVFGYHPFRQRARYVPHIGVVFGSKTILWWDVPLIESFKLYADMYGVSRFQFNQRLARFQSIFDLEPHLHTPPRKLSLGERMRAEIVASILHAPPVLFLDEPTIGLDVVAREDVRTFLKSLHTFSQTTIIYTSHILTDVEQLCNRVIILNDGRIVTDGPVEEIRRLAGWQQVRCTYSGVKDAAALKKLLARPAFVGRQDTRTLVFRVASEEVPLLVKELLSGVETTDLSVEPPSLEEVLKQLCREDGS